MSEESIVFIFDEEKEELQIRTGHDILVISDFVSQSSKNKFHYHCATVDKLDDKIKLVKKVVSSL